MVVLRNRLSAVRAGGPRQFAELRDRVLIRVDEMDRQGDVVSKLDNFGLEAGTLNNAPVVTAEPREKVEDVLENVMEMGDATSQIRDGIQDIQDAADGEDDIIDITTATISATTEFINQIRAVDGVDFAEFVRTEADFGPENLRSDPNEMETVPRGEAQDKEQNMEVINENYGLSEVWESGERGSNAIVAIFDTGFADGLIDSSRIVGRFHAGGTDSVWASAEGHGTMTAGAACASKEEGAPYNGTAPGAKVMLVRITDEDGQIRSDIISQGWDWLIERSGDMPIVANHSYGTPLCSGRPKAKFCNTVINDVISIANSSSDITSVYAAGNEAMQCGHRPFGFTNAITGTNSISEVITVGALLSNGREAQKYSSHGRGDCAPIDDPKPNVSFPLPKYTYYGVEDGWKVKDMSTGPFGSSGGTSHASPSVAGIVALMQSKAAKNGEPLQTEEIKKKLQDTAVPPRRTQVNSFGLLIGQKGYDARFGNGMVKPVEALNEV